MRKKDVSGIMHDLLRYLEWRNPLARIFIKGEIKVDLLKREVTGTGKDSLWEFYHEKISWFHWRLVQLGADLKDFQKAQIFVHGAREKLMIVFKNKKFSDELEFRPLGSFKISDLA